ncbi:hypothetical protein ACWF9B_00240 [Streptomyces sp. NPDC055089]
MAAAQGGSTTKKANRRTLVRVVAHRAPEQLAPTSWDLAQPQP